MSDLIYEELRRLWQRQERQVFLMLLKWRTDLWGKPRLIFDKHGQMLGLGPETEIGEIQPIHIRVEDVVEE